MSYEPKVAKRFFLAALFFLFVGGFIGVLMRWGLGLPKYAPFPAVFFFNLITVHPFMLLVGWATTMLMGVVYFELPRLTNGMIYSTRLAFTQLYVQVAGLLTILFSGSLAMFTAYPPLRHTVLVPVGGILVTLAVGMFALNVIQTIKHRPKRGNPDVPVIAQYFAGGAITLIIGMILWAAVMVVGIAFPRMDALLAKELIWVALRFYLQGGILITLIGVLFLLSCKLWGRPNLYSPGVARIELFLIPPLTVFPAHWQHLLSDPVPIWKKVIGTLTAELVLLTFVMSIFNIYLSAKHGVAEGPATPQLKTVRRFFKASVVGYSLVCLTGALQGTLPINVIVHNTQWVAGHIHIVALATLTMLGFTVLYYYLPQITGGAFNAKLANIHLGFFIVGVYWMIISLKLAGLKGLELTAGMVRRAGISYDPLYWPYMFSSLVGLLIILISLPPFLLNLVKMLRPVKPTV